MSKVVIIQFPGVNCEHESLRAIEEVGLQGEIRRWNDARQAVRDAAAVLIPGGWSYQDRIRAGVVAAKDSVTDEIVSASQRGVPVLGICNGAQILVEMGVVPGFEPGRIQVALAPNRMNGRRGYYCNWVYLAKGPAPCIFTELLEDGHAPLPVPLAHAEGRFVTADAAVHAKLEAGEGVAFTYTDSDGRRAEAFPENPNGSVFAIAAMTNPAGNVMAIMPHPERAAWLHQIPRRVGGEWGRQRDAVAADRMFAAGPGRAIFSALGRALS